MLYALEKKKDISSADIRDVCASFQAATVEVLAAKTLNAAKKFRPKSIMVAGGVSANSALKNSLENISKELGLEFFAPELKYTGDNAAMIACAAYYQIASKKARLLRKEKVFSLEVNSNWHLAK